MVVDETGVDEAAVDETGVDKTAVDETGAHKLCVNSLEVTSFTYCDEDFSR